MGGHDQVYLPPEADRGLNAYSASFFGLPPPRVLRMPARSKTTKFAQNLSKNRLDMAQLPSAEDHHPTGDINYPGWDSAHAFLPHRALAAFAAICDRLRGPNFAALATPTFNPPSRPRATACGFLGCSSGWYFSTWPVDSSMIRYASSFGSRGRLLERSAILIPVWQIRGACQPSRNFKLTHYRNSGSYSSTPLPDGRGSVGVAARLVSRPGRCRGPVGVAARLGGNGHRPA